MMNYQWVNSVICPMSCLQKQGLCQNRIVLTELCLVVNCVPGVIVNHPCDIWGYDDSTMMIGVVTAYQHAREETTYMWFKAEELVESDPGARLLVVEEPGIYQCVVKFGNVTEVSKPI